MSKFRTRLSLNPLDDRLVPSTVPLAGPPEPPAQEAATAAPYVTINTGSMANLTQIQVCVETADGRVTTVNVNIPDGTSQAAAAALIAAALNAEGIAATSNGTLVTVTGGTGDNELVGINVYGTQQAPPLGPDNPAITPPDATGHNGAYGNEYLNLPRENS